MKEIKDYTKEELIALYKRMNVYTTTWWYKHYKTYDNHYKDYLEKHDIDNAPVILIDWYRWNELNPKYDYKYWSYHYGVWFSNISNSNVEMKIDNINGKIERGTASKSEIAELTKLKYKLEAGRINSECLWWFGQFETYKEKWDNGEIVHDFVSPDEHVEELHMNDNANREFGRATDFEVYSFVWNTLQWLTVDELNKLLKFAENGVVNKWQSIKSKAGRKSRIVEILQMDFKSGEVVHTYSTRNEVIENTGISKQHLSKCILTAKNSKDMNSWKKWKDVDGTVYVFYENFI